ncbi:MAG: matrixin family metalloprotease [bacterium]
MNKGVKYFLTFTILLLLAGGIFYFRVPLYDYLSPFLKKVTVVANNGLEKFNPPCQKPISYSLGDIDKKFNLLDKQLLTALQTATSVWSKSIDRQLFVYATTSGELAINLVYDYRQAATDKLKSLGIVVNNDQGSFDKLKAKYESLNKQYQQQKATLDSLIANFKQQQKEYESTVTKWNNRGGAPKITVDQLNQTQTMLNEEVEKINILTAKLNETVAEINAMATVLNRLIAELNLNVSKYNNVVQSTGGEFEEGVYIQDADGKRINVYEYNNYNILVRLLEHELGHALGLDHTSSTVDIMYYLNQASNQALSANDLAALKNKCEIK